MDEAYQEEDDIGVNQQTDEDDIYGEEANTETDAYEVMVQQQRNKL